jgi:hypothetical protein
MDSMSANQYDALFQAAGQQHNVDPDLLRAMAQQESGFNPAAVSPKGAVGILQLMPDTAKDMRVVDRTDPSQNIYGAARYMSQLIGKYGDVDKAVQAYNMGPTAFDRLQAGKGALPNETAQYLSKVSGNFNRIKSNAGFVMPEAQQATGTMTADDPIVAALSGKASAPKAAQAMAAQEDPIVAALSGKIAPPTTTTQQTETKAPNNVLMGVNAAYRGIAGIPDALLNTPNRVINLGKAAVGTIADMAGRPDLAPGVTPDPDFVRRGFEKLGLIRPEWDPATSGQRVASNVIQGGVGALVNPANGLRQAATNAAVGGLAGGAAGLTQEATGNSTLAMTAGMLAPAVASRAINSAQQSIANNKLRQQQNAARDQNIADTRAAGYVISPSEINPSTMNRAIEGVAGKLSTRQLASSKNQNVTNRLVREDLGIAEDTPMTPELMSQIRRDAYQAGYAPVEAAGAIRPGAAYKRDLDNIAQQFKGAARSFPAAVSDEVGNMIDSLKVREFDAADGVKMAQVLRDQSSKSYANGDKALGKAQRGAATAIEDQIERGLTGLGKSGADMLDNFRMARQLMAKTHSVESAMNPSTGNIEAQKLAAQLRKGKPLSGNLETVANAALAFPKNFQSMEKVGAIPGFSPLDMFSGAGLGMLGASATGGAGGAVLAALPAIRPAARSVALSPQYQKRFANPDYSNSLTNQAIASGDLKNPQLLAAILAMQQAQSQKK